MSTKIFTAYRIREGFDPWETCMLIKQKGREAVTERLSALFDKMLEGFRKEDEGLIETWHEVFPDRNSAKPFTEFNLIDVNDYVKAQYGAQLKSHQRNVFDFDVAVAVRVFEGRWLLIPYADYMGIVGGVLDFMGDMEELEDYHYQNQSDPPDPLPENWGERREVWDTLCDDWSQFMSLDIVSYTGWFDISPAFQRAFAQAKKDMEDGKSAKEAVEENL